MAAAQQERNTVAELQVELVGFKDRIRVAEAELAKNAPVIAQLNHSNQNMGNRVCALTQMWPAASSAADVLMLKLCIAPEHSMFIHCMRSLDSGPLDGATAFAEG